MSLADRLRRALRGPPLPSGVELCGAQVLEGVRVGGGVDCEGIEALGRRGFRAVVAVGAEGEPGARMSPSVEASWAHTFGIAHARLYVDGPLCSAHVDELRALLEELPRPLYLHSREGGRAAALSIVLLALERNLDDERALGEASAAGLELRSDDLRRFVREELRARADRAAG